MKLRKSIEELKPLMMEWRHEIHAYPEIAFEEFRTASFVEEKLREWGLEVESGIAKTGVVGTLRGSGNGPAIAIRADMDALEITEETGLDYASQHKGKMHACGHDGHTAMLLGAAYHLSMNKRFKGTVHFIFQPAEEGAGGAKVMMEEGLFEKFPVDAVYGLHNWPGLPVGHFAAISGPVMAAADLFKISISGKGTHGAMPHLGADPIVCASQIVMSLQTITSRNIDPVFASVVSITKINGGSTMNVIPEKVILEGTARAFDDSVRDQIESRIRKIAIKNAESHDCISEVSYNRNYPATVNSLHETELAAAAAESTVGSENLHRTLPACMGAEDFAFMLNEKPGCYIWMGNGSSDGGRILHNPRYDFNDDALPFGANYWVNLVEGLLK